MSNSSIGAECKEAQNPAAEGDAYERFGLTGWDPRANIAHQLASVAVEGGTDPIDGALEAVHEDLDLLADAVEGGAGEGKSLAKALVRLNVRVGAILRMYRRSREQTATSGAVGE